MILNSLSPVESFLIQVNSGRFILVTSALVQAELDAAPEEVRLLFDEMITQAEIAAVVAEVIRLQ